MSKQFKVAVNTGKESENTLLDVPPKAGANGQPLRIKATPGAKYQLQEVSDTGKSSGKPVGPDFVKTRRVGKNLQILLEGSTEADVIIEDYYDVFVDGYNGLVGQAENGSFYEYIPEDPDTAGLVGSLRDGGQAVNAALGGAEVQGAGAAIGLLAFNPLLGALGLLGAGAAAVAAANTTGTTGTGTGTGTTPTGTTTGALTATAPNDSGIIGDNLTNDRTPTLSGTVPTGSSASVTINGQTFPVTVNPDGTWTFTQPNNLPDGTYYPVLSVTTNGVTTQTNITPFTIDTTPPTVAVTSSAAALAANETANITFTLSETSTDFALDDIAVTGGQLSNLVQSATDPKIYTARFTPTAGTTPGTATISVASDKFADAAANRNTDGAEPNNTVTIRTNATVTGALTPTAPNDSGTVGDNLTNDTTPALSGKVPAGATATVTLNGQTYPATVNPDGTWTAQVPETGKLPDGTYTPQLNVTSGGVTTTTPITPFTIDTVPAKVAVTSNTNTLGSGQTANVTFTLTEPVNDFTADDVVVTGGTLGPLTKSPTDPKIYTATFTPSNTGTTASISVPSDKFADAAGNRNTDGAEPDNTVSLTTNAPISGQLAPVSDNTVGTPNDQKTNDPTPNLIGKVPAGSSATITLNGQTSPVTVAPDGTWTFTQPTNLPDGTYTPQLNVTTGSVTTSQNITPFTVDTVAPTVAITSSVNTSTTPLSAGQSTVLSFTVSEATTNLTDADLAVVGGTLGPLQQSATNPLLYTATFTATPGITASTTASVSLDSDKFSDAAGNLNKDGAEANNTWSTSVTPTTNPTPNPNGVKTALSINPIATDNVLLANEGTATTYPVTGKVTGAFAAGDIVNIALNGKNYPTAVAADGSFSVTVSMADLKADPDTKVEGSITGTGGDTATAAQDYTVETGNTATQTALSIDPVTADNLLNATESTNPVAITGKVTGRFAAGDTVTLTVNGKIFTGAAAANGNFSINVPGADLKADSDTTVDGRVTGTGGSTANAIQNYALSDSSTVSPSLKTALSIDPILGDNVISATEGNANSYTVTGKVTGTFAPGDIVEVKLNDKTYAAAVAADGSYSVAVPMSALKADPDTKIEASITGTGGDPATAAQDYTVETSNAPTQTSLTINPVTADNILGSTESTGNIPITGKVNGKFSTGDTVTLSVNGKTFTGTAAADGSYSIAVPAADLLADPDTQVDGTVTGAGGTLARALQDYGVDANVNPVNPSVKTALSINPILGDNVISTAEGNANNYTVTGKVTGAFKEGDLVELQLNNKTYATTVAADGSYSVPVPMADLKADADTKIEARITGTGGDTATAAQDYTVEGNTNSGRTTLSIDPVTADNVINNTESTTTATNVTGKVSGTFAAGDTVTLTVNGKPFTGTAAANGNFSISVPTADLVADKDTTVEGTVTGTGGTTANAIQDYGLNTDGGTNPVDTTPPTIAITSNQASLATGQQATITFTLSEASTDFVWNGTTGDINVTGGTLGALTQSSSNPLVYTAVFTPATNSTANGVISVASDRFSDAAGNFNKDGADANNTVTLSVNTTTTAPALSLTNDAKTVAEEGLNVPAATATGNVLSNDTGNTPKVSGIQAASATNATPVGSTGNTSVTGQFGSLAIAENGTYTYTVNNANDNVQALRTGSQSLSDVFTYTANDGTGAKTANLVITITGTNDAPTLTTAVADRTGTVGTALNPFSVASNFTDVDSTTNGETATLTAKLANGADLPSWLTFNPATGTFSGTPTAAGTTSVTVTRTDAAGANVSDTFDIVVAAVTDTTPPTIAITSNQASLATGQQATITFTLSEPSTDFVWNGTTGDISVSGGNLGALTQDPLNSRIYTAVFTPAANSTTNGVIKVESDKFSDAAGNFNKDGADANNTVTLTVNTTTAAPALSLTNDARSVAEEGLNVAAATASGNVLSNDSGNSPKVTGIQPLNGTSTTAVSGTGNTTLTGQFGSLAIAENGIYTYTVNNANANVQALRTGSQSLSDVFTYTANDGTGAKTANLVITITGTNDAPILTSAVADRTGTVGTALATFSVASNFDDVDSAANGETVTLSATLANGSALPSWLTFNAATGSFSGTPTAAGTTSVRVTRTDAAGANVSDTFDITVTTTGTASGKLAPSSDSGVTGDNLTNDKTPALEGTAPIGSTAVVNVGGKDYPVTVKSDGTWSLPATNELLDGTYTPVLKVTPAGGGTPVETNLTPFTIDTVPPTVRVEAASKVLAANTPTTITFTLSEEASDLTRDDVIVTGGEIGPLTKTSTNPLVYTATFTPAATGTSATISIDSDRFSDAAANLNKDSFRLPGAENTNNQVTLATNSTSTGQLAPASDSGTKGDNKTNDDTPALSGTAPTGSTAVVTINDKEYPVTVKPDGTWDLPATNEKLPDGTYTPVLKVTPAGGGTPVSTNLTPFTIDTVAPTIKVETSTKVLTANATTTVTFTLSEEASDFTKDDVVVTGGAISDPVRSSTNPLVYTATFTPTTTGTSATIGVDSDRFSDAAANLNKDSFRLTGAENTNNQVTLATNASSSGQLAPTSDTGVPGDNLTNDKTPALEGKAPTGSSAVVTIAGVDYPVTVKPDGTWSLPATNELLDGTYTPVLKVTPAGGGTPVSTDLTPFTIDTVPPTVKVEAASTTLLPNRGTTVTFTLSEASSDFTKDDVVVTGGSITDPVKSSSNPLVYTATFTPAATGTTASITIDNERFADAAGNRNQDSFRLPGAENTNNQVNFSTNFASTGQLAPDSDTGAKGDNLTKDDTPALTGKVPPGSSATVTVNGKPYPATVNPDGSWTAQIPDTEKLPDGTYTPVLVVTPAGGGTPVETNLTPFTIDTKPPTVSITSDSTVLTTGKTALITFTLSEEAADFVKDDIVVTGGDIGTLKKSSTDPKVYTATFTPTSTATTATIRIDSNKFSDAATNFNIDTGTNPAPAGATFETNNLVTLATNAAPTDTTAPTVIVTRNGTGTLTSSETITFTLSEPSKDFTQADLSTNTGSFSNFTPVPTSGTAATGYTQYTATFTPVAGSSGQATIGVRAGRFSDAAGNQNKDTFQIGASGEVLEDNNKVDISFNTITPAPDTTPPTVIVSRAGTGSLTQGGSDTITFTLSENSLTFVQDDVTVTGGTLTNWTQVASSGSPTTGYHLYTATFTPTPNSNGTATVGVKASTFKDLAGNNNQDTFEPNLASTTFEPNNQVSIGFNTTTADTTPPAVAVVRSNTGTITGPETILFNFSEAIAPTSFVANDITVSGGTISNLVAVQGSGNKQFSATFTPTSGATGTATIGVLAGKFTDTSNNANVDTFETASANYEANNHVSAAFDTSATAPVDKTTPTVSITRIGSGTIGTGPGVSGATETIVFTFSEAIDPASFTAADVDISSGTISAITAVPGSNNTQFTATYTPTPGLVGNATIGIVAGKFSDAAGNLNLDTYLAPTTGSQQVQESNNQITLGYNSDTTPPTVIVSRATSNTVTGTETITFTLSEASTTFSKEDIDLIGTGPLGTLGTLTPDTTSGNANTGYTRYSIVYTAPANNAGDIKIGVLEGKFSDTVGNQNTDSYKLTGPTNDDNAVSLSYNTYPVDRVAPTIAVTRSGSGTLTGPTANETITFTLSEASTNFSESDITTTGGTLSNFAAVTTSGTAGTGYTRYTATFTPTASGSGTATVGVKSGQFTDNAGNANQDSYELTGAENANNQVSIAYNSTGADTTPPTIIVTRTGSGTLAAGQTETLLFTTSEVAHFDETRITVIKGGTLSNVAPVASSGSVTTGYTQWTATFTPTPGSSGQAQIGVLNGKVDDMAGNFNTDTYTQGQAGTVYEANNLVSFNYDTNTKDSTPPTIVVTRSGSGTVKTSETIFFTLSEASKDFSDSDIDVFGGALTGFSAVPSTGNAMTGYTQYVATFTPNSGKGVANIGVKSGKFSDAAQNLNTDTYEQGATGFEANNQVFLDFNTASTDTTPPTVAVIRSTNNVLKVGATELITFVLSEASLDFAIEDIAYDGGTLSNLTRVTTSGNSTNGYTQYTALFTPNANSTGTAAIGVVHGKFSDAAGLLNQDTYLSPQAGSTQVQEGNNQVKIVFNTVPANGPGATPDTASATETGGKNNNSLGINPSGSVLDNDTTATTTKVVQDINIANGTAKPVAANSSKDNNATSITGSYGTLLIGADGTYKYTVNNDATAVQALRTSTDTLTDTFTYTINDGTSATASTTLTVTVRGANDAPVLVTAVADTSATIGTPFSYAFASNTFNDIDTGDTLSYSAKLAGGADLPSWLSFNPASRTFGGTAPAGAPSTVDIQITATDLGNQTATDTFQITIGNNHAPTLAPISAPAAIAELANAAAQDIAAINGVLVVNDVDTGNTTNASTIPASVTWSGGSTLPQGADVSELISIAALKFGTGVTPNGSAQKISWTYDPKAANLDWLAKGQTLTLTYPVTINDGQNGSATQNLVITITGTNDAPVASNIAKPYNKGAGTDSFSLIGNATDLDNGETAGLTLDTVTDVTYSIDGGTASTSLPAGITRSGNTLSIDPSNAAFAALSTGQTQVIVATYNITDAQGATTQQTATLTIKGSGTGDPIAADDAGTITEQGGTNNNIGSTFVQNDSLIDNDKAFGGASLIVDTIKAGTAAGTASSVPTTGNTQVTGQFGTLSVNKSGGNTYELNNNLPAVQALQAGQTLTDTFTYTIKDSNGKTSTATLTMTIQGANDAPVAVADSITVGEAGGTANANASTLLTTGTVLANDTDFDNTDSKTVTAIRTGNGTDQTVAAATSSSINPKQISGSYGTLNLGADGSYSYTVSDNLLAVQQLKNAGDKLTDTFTYTVKDAAGLSSTSTLTVTITGANDAPTVSVATAPTSATNLSAFNFGTAFSLADIDVGTGLMTLTLSSDANDGRFTVNLGSSGATLSSGGNGTSNTAVISGTLAQLQALNSAASSFSFVDTATQAVTRDITISAVLNDQGNEGALANALTGSNSFKVSMAADPNRNATIDITAITNDTGYQANDYITADNTLVFSGTVSGMDASSGRVKLELVDSNNTVLKTAIITPTVSNGNGTWTWTDPLETGTTGRADGDYTLRATIVDLNGNRVNPVSTVGSNTGTQDVQAITIDTNTPNVDPNRLATIDIVTIDDGLSTTTTATGSKDTGTSATDFITSDRTLAYKGTVTGWVSNNGDMIKLELKDNTNTVVATQYVLPQTTNGSPVATWSWDDTGISRNADSTYTLVATIVDKAGNRVNAAEPTNGTNGGTDSQLIVIDNTMPNAGVAPTVVITTDTNNDGVVSGKELGNANTFTVSGAFDKTKVAVGDILVFSDGTNSQSVTLSAGDIGNGFATTTFAKPAEGATLSVTAKLQDTAGQTSATSTPDSAKLDTTAPNTGAVPVVEITTDSNNNGTVNFDELAGASTFTVKGSFDKTKVVAGDILVFKDANNNSQSVTLMATDINNGYATTTFAKPAEGATLTVTVQVEDIYGNASAVSAPDSAKLDTSLPTQIVSFSSMTKDSGVTTTSTINSNWLTNDTSAGRLVSGFLSAPLAAGEVVNVYSNGNLIGTATVAAGGTTWEITDLSGYGSNASWTYTANVVDAQNNAGQIASKVVSTDLTEAPPIITGVTDSVSASIANNGSTANALSTVKGTGQSGDTIFLYANTYTNLVGTAVVDGSGNWSVTSLTGVLNGSNTFAVMQVDAQGNHSALSGLWTVTAPGANALLNGGFDIGGTGFTSELTQYNTTGINPNTAINYIRQRAMYGIISDIGSNTPPPTNTITTAPIAWTNGMVTKNVYQGVTVTDQETTAFDVFFGLAQGNFLAGSLDQVAGNAISTTDLWASNVNVVQGKTYSFSFVYWNTAAKDYKVGPATNFMDVKIDGVIATTTANRSAGQVTITYTANKTGAVRLSLESWNPSDGGDYFLDDFKFAEVAQANTLGLTGPTENPDTLTYTAGALDALASDDTVTVTATNLQATLAAGGIISGGAGIDNLKLAAGTTLNLEALTGNQTVKPIEQIEIITMQGGSSKLTMSANNVLSLGGANATTMEPYSFSTTNQVPNGSVQATGSTSSTGKVQFVVNGQTGDTLNLDVLANDGVTSTNGASSGLLGNTGLNGSWAYKGTISIAADVAVDGVAHTYKVYDHSTTGAQVLVDVNVTVNTITPISITAISTDAGVSATDFITNDQTLTYSGGLPAAFNPASERVMVEIVNSANQVVSSGFASPSGTTWSWVDTKVETAGNYTIRCTIVGLSNTTAVGSYGAGASATQTLTIDLTPPTVAITRTDGLSTTVGASGTEVTFTVSEATTDLTNSDIDVSGGFLSPLVQSSTNPLLYTATFTPTMGATGTASVRIASGKFTDAAGNLNLDTYVSTDANYQANNLLNIAYDTAPPTQTVSFSSMSKDSGVTSTSTINSNWLTNDTSAGRLVSGFLSAPLAAGEVVNVYADGNLIGTATVASGGTTWEITDLNGYGSNASWTYTANVVDAQNNAGQIASKVVSTDLTEAPPIITGVTDSISASIANNGSTANALNTVTGTGVAGNTIFLYDNNYTTLVGKTVVGSNGIWSVTSLAGTFSGSNTFAAVQMDPQGNQSVTSNLWTVNAPAAGVQLLTNGNFSQDWGVGFTTNVPLIDQSAPDTYERFSWIRSRDAYSVIDLVNQRGGDKGGDFPGWTGWNLATDPASAPLTQRATQSWTNGTWSQKVYLAPDKNLIETTGWGTFYNMASGKILAGSLVAGYGDGLNHNLWVANASVVAGKTYTFKFNYWDTISKDTNTNGQPGDAATFMDVSVNGQYVMSTNSYATGEVTINYVATTTGSIPLVISSYRNATLYGSGDYALDNMSFTEAVPTNTLTPGAFIGATPNPDNLSYTAGVLDALESEDTITVTTTSLQATLAAGGVISGGAGVDTLKLAAGTSLDLLALTSTQTVKSVQQVEVFQLQGGSTLSLSANNVMSLGGTELAGYNFTSSTGGASSTGKVQFVIKATSTDTVNLSKLMTDGVTTSGTAGNTGLSGAWADMGTTSIGGVTYKVYNHSTTSAQVLVSNANVTLPSTLAPVAVDLNHDGLMGYSQILMDLNGDAVLDTTAWVGSQDGLLVRDSYGDGSVRSTSQFVFARNNNETDLQGLAAQFDSNHDSVLDAKDAQFADFAVWQDSNQNGVADAGEVRNLSDLGIQAIELISDGVVRTPATGVTEAGHTTAQLTDGTTLLVTDASFAYTLGTVTASQTTQVNSAELPNPTHCDEPWIEPVTTDVTTDIFSLDTTEWQNKPYALSAEQMAELNLNVPADDAMASMLKAADVLLDTLDPKALQHALHESMTDDGALNLNKLLTTDFVQDSLTTLQTLGHTPDTTLQMLLDTHMQTAAV